MEEENDYTDCGFRYTVLESPLSPLWSLEELTPPLSVQPAVKRTHVKYFPWLPSPGLPTARSMSPSCTPVSSLRSLGSLNDVSGFLSSSCKVPLPLTCAVTSHAAQIPDQGQTGFHATSVSCLALVM